MSNASTSSGAAKTVSLVLGSGGARGLAHIGVIRYLDENGFQIRSIAGSSMGALVGGIYGLGKLDQYEHWVTAITRVEILSLLDISLQGGGLIRGDRIIDRLRDFLGDARIEDLPIRFTAVATDIASEKEVWIEEGPLFDAIRASISIPLFFTPAEMRGVLLVDGGILNPVPIAPTFGDDTDLTIAVNLNGRRSGKGGPKPARKRARDRERDDSLLDDVRDEIERFISRLGVKSEKSDRRNLGAYEIASQSFETMQSAIARHKLASYPPDILIEIPRDSCRTLEFDRAEEMIELGRQRASQVMG